MAPSGNQGLAYSHSLGADMRRWPKGLEVVSNSAVRDRLAAMIGWQRFRTSEVFSSQSVKLFVVLLVHRSTSLFEAACVESILQKWLPGISLAAALGRSPVSVLVSLESFHCVRSSLQGSGISLASHRSSPPPPPTTSPSHSTVILCISTIRAPTRNTHTGSKPPHSTNIRSSPGTCLEPALEARALRR